MPLDADDAEALRRSLKATRTKLDENTEAQEESSEISLVRLTNSEYASCGDIYSLPG